MSERLTDDELNSLDTTASWLVNKPDRVKLTDDQERRVGMRVSLAITELRSLRAQALSDVAALNLRRLVDVIRGFHGRNGDVPMGTTLDLCEAVEKLLGGERGGDK